ncbi:hypothetical protein BX600DRAFT_503920 [Xylariales sp. PMI_506]|nr:hypothetical protein BX600DRAFT_503920 [Xylariales sp. PMI_506]
MPIPRHALLSFLALVAMTPVVPASATDVSAAAEAAAEGAVAQVKRSEHSEGAAASRALQRSPGREYSESRPARPRAAPAGVDQLDFQSCSRELAPKSLNVTYVDSTSVEIRNVPSNCMSVAEQYQDVYVNSTTPLACGDHCLYYENLSSVEQRHIESFVYTD